MSLNFRVKIQKCILVQDEELNQKEIYQDYKTLWAGSLRQSGHEFTRLKTQFAEVQQVFKIRYSPDIDSRMRVIHNNTEYAIISVINLEEKNRWMLLNCKAVA